MNKVNIAEKFEKITKYYSPKIAGELNGQYVKLAKLKGSFVMHKHDDEDELFLVIKGSMEMKYTDRTDVINEGEFVIVPRGVEHCPNAEEEVHLMLFEPKSVVNTGEIENEKTVKPEDMEWI
jgi:mannose-6-phosphate isomerase-like protein (cupin superfamily)